MFKRSYFIVFTLLTSVTLLAQDYPTDYFQSPLDIPLILSGTYGELRSNHFHAGIDIKTQGREGLPVNAAAAGQVVRIAVSPYGYGNALYIRHPNGYTTVYAHLQSFQEDIAQWVESQQYQQKSFQVNLFPPAELFQVTAGQQIALSGNSGGSGGPHLHFEIRDSRTEEPLNPLLFGYDIADSRFPEVRGVYAYPLGDSSHLNQRHTRTSLSLGTIQNGQYALKWTQRASGQIGFAIDVIDRQDGAWNANGPFRIEQFVNEVKTAEFRAERFAFSESRFLNAHIDYDLYRCCQTKANRMWLLPGNELNMYDDVQGNGILSVYPDSTYDLEWRIHDVAGNTTILTASIQGEELVEPAAPMLGLSLPYDATTTNESGAFRWKITPGVLYQNQRVVMEEHPSLSTGYGPVYQLGTQGIAVHKHFEVALSLKSTPLPYLDKAVIVSLDDDRTNPDSWDGDVISIAGTPFLKSRVRTMGHFTVMLDTIPPTLRYLNGIRNNRQLKAGDVISFKMTDDLSGIRDYRCEINGEWHLMAYDAKNDLLRVVLSDRISEGACTMSITAKDDRNNTTSLDIPFTFSL